MMHSHPVVNGSHRICSKCEILLPLEEFTRDSSKSSGFRPRCKSCIKKDYDSKKEHYVNKRREYVKNNKEKLREQQLSLPWRYRDYTYSAKSRNIEFDLTMDEFSKSKGKPCFYCGDILNDYKWDRVNNDLGYSVGNVVPCCTSCNMMKMTLLKDQFIMQCKKISARH